MPIESDPDDRSKVYVLHAGQRVGYLRVKQLDGHVRVGWVERTKKTKGSGGAFALAYHELMAEFSVPTVRSDFKMSNEAKDFWRALRPVPPARKLLYRHGLADEKRSLGEPEDDEIHCTDVGDEVVCRMQNEQYILTEDPKLWSSDGMTEVRLSWTWTAPVGLVERVEDCAEFYEAYGSGGTPVAEAASQGASLNGPATPALHVAPFAAHELLLDGDTHRRLMAIPRAARDATFTAWVAASLAEVEPHFD